MIRKADTDRARAIWAGVAIVARLAPDWMRPKIRAAAERSARRILGKPEVEDVQA